MTIKPLSSTSFHPLYTAFNHAFADYEMQLQPDELKSMLIRRGFDADLSFAAFEDEHIVSFTFNGIGNYNGLKTAYDTGTGTLKAFRGQGLAKKIFEYSIPYLKESGIRHYLLEVLQHNTSAVSVYRNVGFLVSREFNYFVWNNNQINHNIQPLESNYYIQLFDTDLYPSLANFWDFQPSWQNSFDSILRAKEKFIHLGVFSQDALEGYCIFEPLSGDITQLAVHKNHRRKGIGSRLLYEVSKLNTHAKTKIINTEVHCNSITGFLKSKNIEVSGKQFEMIKEI